MNETASGLCVLAEGLRGNGLQLNPLALTVGLLGIAAVLLIWWIVARLSPLIRRRNRKPRPWKVFLGLCRVHRLGWRDRWLLYRIAKRQGLADPARLFLEPERFEASPDFTPRQRKSLDRIAERIFLGIA